jgi:hypothetical protein
MTLSITAQRNIRNIMLHNISLTLINSYGILRNVILNGMAANAEAVYAYYSTIREASIMANIRVN